MCGPLRSLLWPGECLLLIGQFSSLLIVQGSECTVQNHVAICRCPRGTTGDPFRNCRRFTRDEICAPCGINTDCEVITPITSCALPPTDNFQGRA